MLHTRFSLFERSKRPEGVLVIVDVQEAFSKYFTDDYINALFAYCEGFDNVCQVWDDIGQSSPSYLFPHETLNFSKSYGFDLDDDTNFNGLFEEPTATTVYDKYINSGFKPGEAFETRFGGLLVFVGQNHDWFLCPGELYSFFKRCASTGVKVTMVGGADKECLADVLTTATVCGCNVVLDRNYVYSYNSCPVYSR